MKSKPIPLFGLAAGLALSLGHASAALRLPSIISDHMVLDAGQPSVFWGWADPDSRITVSFAGSGGSNAKASATTGKDGRWELRLPALPAGSAGKIEITGDKEESKEIEDVLVGRVWLAGGQSNMDYRVDTGNVPRATVEAARREATALKGAVRYYLIPEKGADEPLDDVVGQWFVASPESVGRCSAVAWYFGVKLHEDLQQPVGLVCSSVGATPVQAWMPKTALDATSVGEAVWKRHQDGLANYTPEAEIKYKADFKAWQVANPTGALQAQNAASKPREPYGPTSRGAPVRFYNGMIHGLEPYTLDGVIWFQGDGNAGFPKEYPELIKTLIQTWRKNWGAELYFYYVEMNNMWEPQVKPVENNRNLAPIREEQAAALELPRTGVVAALDLGDAEARVNPHFPNKKPVGDRLANLIAAEAYGKELGEVHSPEFAGYIVDGGDIRLRFKYAGGLRTRDGGPVKGFAIRGADGDWVWADAKISGQEIIVSNDQIPQPKAARYAWAANPVISVVNGAGLPMRPFRTDKDDPW
jgi:sialate O-acetylesterase